MQSRNIIVLLTSTPTNFYTSVDACLRPLVCIIRVGRFASHSLHDSGIAYKVNQKYGQKQVFYFSFSFFFYYVYMDVKILQTCLFLCSGG